MQDAQEILKAVLDSEYLLVLNVGRELIEEYEANLCLFQNAFELLPAEEQTTVRAELAEGRKKIAVDVAAVLAAVQTE